MLAGRSLSLLVLVALSLVPAIAAAAPADTTLRVMTFNIRYDNPSDGVDAWPHRQARVASVIRFHEPAVAGLQEALRHQIDALAEELPTYDWVGVGRDDGADGGEFSPIFYHVDHVALVDHGTFWLSETPDVVGSRGWDAALPRIATWGHFRLRATGAEVVVLNTHFDHLGQQAREASARLIVDRLDALAGGLPVVVLGDFNVTPENPAYATLTGRLRDAFTAAETPPHGPAETFFGFTYENGEVGRRIDYIFVGPGWRVRRFGTLAEAWGGHFASDHLPVLADLQFERF